MSPRSRAGVADPSQRPERSDRLSAKDEILARLRTALAEPGQPEPLDAEQVPRAYQRADSKQETATDPAKIRDVLVGRLEEYGVHVHRTDAAGLPATVAQALDGKRPVLAAPGVPASWLDAVTDEIAYATGAESARELDAVGAVVTGCHTVIALTGTVVLRSDDVCGARALSLVPDHHVVVVQPEQIVLGVPAGIRRMQEDPCAAWTMVSGPSATSDIELSRVDGVHGPRTLHVIILDPETAENHQETSDDSTDS